MAEISEQLLGAIDALRYENAQYHDENYLKQGKIVDNTAAVAKNIVEQHVMNKKMVQDHIQDKPAGDIIK